MISINNLSFNYEEVNILDSIDLIIKNNGLTCLVGGNGVGKSTLLNLIVGELELQVGAIHYNDKNINKSDLLSKISYLPSVLYDPLYITVRELLYLSRFNNKGFLNFKLESEDKKKIQFSIEKCGLQNYSNRIFSSLSSGEKQKVWLAFCIAQDKNFIFLDEALNNLDYDNKDIFFNLLKEISINKGVLISTHNIDMVIKYADRVLVLKDKKIVYDGLPKKDLYKII
ncbi:MAG: ABC transporter ATP-binding protein [Dehalococcoidia bacterium]